MTGPTAAGLPDEPLQPGYDPETLAEVYPDPAAVAARIEQLHVDLRVAPDEIAELLARAELTDLLRAAGRPDEALNEANAAVDRAEMVGTRAQQHLARLRLAHVHQQRGEFADSTVLVTELLAAATQFGPVIEAFTHQQAGLDDFAQGHWADAAAHFARALELRDALELPEADRAPSRVALAAAQRRRASSGEPAGTSAEQEDR